MALDQTDWNAAQKIIGRWIEAGRIGQLEDTSQTVAAAVKAFNADADDRGLASATREKYELSLGRLEDFCTEVGITGALQARLSGSPRVRPLRSRPSA
jgi:hypothetical protein